MEKIFKEDRRTHLGDVTTHSGVIAIADDISITNNLDATPKVTIDIEQENVSIPAYGILTEGRRYILLDIDAARSIQVTSDNAIVDVADHIELSEESEESEENEE